MKTDQNKTKTIAFEKPEGASNLALSNRGRLFAMAVLILGIRVLFIGRSYIFDHHAPPVASFVGTAIAAVCAYLLSRRVRLTPLGLECASALLVVTTIFAAGASYVEVLGGIADKAMGADAKLLMQYRLDAMQASAYIQAAIAILILIFGLFIPMSLGRTLVTLIPMGVSGLCLPWLASQIHDQIEQLDLNLESPANLSITACFHTLATASAVYGSIILGRLRLELHEARTIGSYVLKHRIGGGGMGEVWQAEHSLLARPAAIKMIKADGLKDGRESPHTVLKRFEKEARATAMLSCPHTVGIFDYGATPEGGFYYAMEMLDGVDLDSLVRSQGPVPPERAVHILIQCCLSLAEAHARGLIHRDIKPANISLCRVGMQLDYVKVFDFGLVKRSPDSGDESLTKVGAMGTPAFIAPEQARGEELDGRADLYALGCVAFWLLTGRFVFERRNPVEMALDHMNASPPPPSSRAGSETEISAELDNLVLSCLAKKASDRPADAMILHDRLRAIPFARPWTDSRAREWWRLHGPSRPPSPESKP